MKSQIKNYYHVYIYPDDDYRYEGGWKHDREVLIIVAVKKIMKASKKTIFSG